MQSLDSTEIPGVTGTNATQAPAVKDIVNVLEYSSSLVTEWGQAKFAGGQTVSETLTLEGIPLWEAVAVDLARLYVPQALAAAERPPSFIRRVRPYLSWAKQALLAELAVRRKAGACPSWPKEPTILLLGAGTYLYRDVLQPIAERCASKRDIRTLSLCLQAEPSRQYEMAQFEHESIWRHWDDEGRALVRAVHGTLQVVARAFLRADGLPRIVNGRGWLHWDQMRRMFVWLFRIHLPRLLPQAAMACHILERHRPALIISPDVADPCARLYCLLGRRFGVPSLQVQFGACGQDGIEWKFLAADRVAVWGQQAREAMLKHGVPDERIVITGSPRYDCLAQENESAVERVRAKLGIPTTYAMVLFASVYYLKAYEGLSDPALPDILIRMKKAIFEAARKTPGIVLIVKPHPCEQVYETKQLAVTGSNIQFVDQHADIRELIQACDAFVSFGSTSTMDALIAGKMTICPVFPGWSWNEQFAKSGATLVPDSPSALERCFQLVADGLQQRALAELEPARERFLQEWMYKPDGQASARLETLARQMAGTQAH